MTQGSLICIHLPFQISKMELFAKLVNTSVYTSIRQRMDLFQRPTGCRPIKR